MDKLEVDPGEEGSLQEMENIDSREHQRSKIVVDMEKLSNEEVMARELIDQECHGKIM